MSLHLVGRLHGADHSWADRRDTVCQRCGHACKGRDVSDSDTVICLTCVDQLRPVHPEPGRYWPNAHDWIRPALEAEAEGRTLHWWCGAEYRRNAAGELQRVSA